MTKVSILYYKQEFNQSKIAEQMGISRPKVSRLLAKARDKGIVKIEIVSPRSDISNLESELSQKFNLKEVILTDMTNENLETECKREIGKAAQSFLERIADGSEYIGVSAGTTVYGFANIAYPTGKEDFKVVPIIGAVADTGKSYNANEVSNLLADNLKGTSFLLNAPALVNDSKTANFFKNENRINNVFNLYNKLDIAILGIGNADYEHPLISGHLSEKELAKFKKLNLCGSISSNFYNLSGDILKVPFKDRIIAISVKKLMDVEFKVGLAVGEYKKEAILGAIRSGLINVLISDKSIGDWLINKN